MKAFLCLFLRLSVVLSVVFSTAILAANNPPVISGQPDTSVVAGDPYRFTPTAIDLDSGDWLTFDVSHLPSWASFDAQTGEVSGIAQLPANQVKATEHVYLTMNLDTRASAPPIMHFHVADAGSYTFADEMTIFDSMGEGHQLKVYFVIPFLSRYQWNVHFSLDGIDLSTIAGTGFGVVPQTLIFTADGQPNPSPAIPLLINSGLSTGMSLALTNGAHFPSPVTIHWQDSHNTKQASQSASFFAMKHIEQDGISAAEVAGNNPIGISVTDFAGASAALPTFLINVLAELDTDGDGIADSVDMDDDNDGVEDYQDSFPLDANEVSDHDFDGIGNNADTDDDGDGIADVHDAFPLNYHESVDTDGDGIGDNSDADIDGDTVANADDAFPFNPDESVDTDGDGIGNHADTDDDNDGVADVDDALPLNSAESLDTDGDGIGNRADTDDDNDGVADIDDAFPFNPAESTDTDGDGIGNHADTDDDNDGVADIDDALPLNSAESVDTDGDGIGNNADIDDDNDGVADVDDAFPLNSAESLDTDGDGIGNHADTDDDNDGVTDEVELASGSNPLDANDYPGLSMPWVKLLLGDRP